MKLYATISNGGPLTVGKGDNENLTISLNRGNRRMVEFYYTIENLSDGNELVVIDMLNLSDGSTTRVLEHEGEKSLPEYQTGKKQQGEKCGFEGCINKPMQNFKHCFTCMVNLKAPKVS